MKFISKIFIAIEYFFSLLLPFIIIFILLFLLSIFLLKKDIISATTIILFTSVSFLTFIFLSILFLIITFTFYLPSIYKYTKTITYIILLLLFFSITLQQISIIKTFSEITNTKNNWIPCKSPKEIFDKFSCFSTGYMPTQTTSMIEKIIIIYGFYIYAFIIPIIVCIKIMKNFVDSSNVIQNETYKNIIAIGISLILYKNIIITKLVEFLYIGYLGVVLLILNLFSINYVIKKIQIMFQKLKAINEREIKTRTIDELKRLTKTSLKKLKLIPSINLISVIFEDRIRNNLKTVFEAENKIAEFENLIAEFENAVNQKNKNAALAAIDRMIAEIN